MADQPLVLTTLHDATLVVTVDNPPVNALSLAVLAALDQALAAAEEDRQVRALIITGAGNRAFAAGADIRELTSLPSAAEALAFASAGQSVLTRIESLDKPVIAAVNGAALGGGCELALACHIRLVAEGARVGQPEITLGIAPGWGATHRLTRLVGPGHALELLLTGEVISAQEAVRIGLANRIAASDMLLPEALALAARIAAHSQLSAAAVLRSVRAGLTGPAQAAQSVEARQFARLFDSHDRKEGLAAFTEKRKPAFTDD
jgi:enoyl-CoA hydratase/carnithine racemase